jgi:hypothetical protein
MKKTLVILLLLLNGLILFSDEYLNSLSFYMNNNEVKSIKCYLNDDYDSSYNYELLADEVTNIYFSDNQEQYLFRTLKYDNKKIKQSISYLNNGDKTSQEAYEYKKDSLVKIEFENFYDSPLHSEIKYKYKKDKLIREDYSGSYREFKYNKKTKMLEKIEYHFPDELLIEEISYPTENSYSVTPSLEDYFFSNQNQDYIYDKKEHSSKSEGDVIIDTDQFYKKGELVISIMKKFKNDKLIEYVVDYKQYNQKYAYLFEY